MQNIFPSNHQKTLKSASFKILNLQLERDEHIILSGGPN